VPATSVGVVPAPPAPDPALLKNANTSRALIPPNASATNSARFYRVKVGP